MQWRGKHTAITIEELLGNGVFCESAPSLYNEDLRQLRRELCEVLELAVEDDGDEKTPCVI
jgi:hypothetical protein